MRYLFVLIVVVILLGSGCAQQEISEESSEQQKPLPTEEILNEENDGLDKALEELDLID